jgi:dipeptidyl aminopeptidase/acylaminoacyl peptidase
MGASVVARLGGLRAGAIVLAVLAACLDASAVPGRTPAVVAPGLQRGNQAGRTQSRPPDFEGMARQQAETDQTWRAASAGFMEVEKITYRSSLGDLDVPAFVFQPLKVRGPKRHPAIVWVHENIRGHLYEHYIPYVREATARGYVVIAPEYRGSLGYGKAFYDAIDYGGGEVDDVVAAVGVLAARYPDVDPARVAIMGWSHGGMIALLSVFRNPVTFKAAVAMVPVTNLFHRLAWKGVERQLRAIDPQNRLGGLPSERPNIYKERSPLFQVDKLRIPLLVHFADNDPDVNIEEGMQLVDALRARKPMLAETKVYQNPAGGHVFDRRVDPKTWEPEHTPAEQDSWSRIWAFLDRNLEPSRDAARAVPAHPRALTVARGASYN